MFRSSCFLFLLIFGILLCPAYEFPDSYYDEDEYFDLDDSGGLVITAGRTPEPAAAVPAQVTVISADDIAASGAANVTEILDRVPGVNFSGAMSGAGSEAISMRGFGENSYGRVLVLVDGNKFNDPDMKSANWNAISLSDIERIEVMDGGASVQYGNNAVGGVVNIITKKSGQTRTLIGVSGGSFFTHRESISHFTPVSWGSYSLSAEYAGSKGYRERQNSGVANVTARSDIFLKGNIKLAANASFADLSFQLPGSLTRDQAKDDPVKAINFNDENTEYHFGGGLALQWLPVGNVELALPLSYRGKIIKYDMASFFIPSYTNRYLNAAEARPQASATFKPADMDFRILGGVDLYFVNLNTSFFGDKERGAKSDSYRISEWTIGPYLTARLSPLENLSFSAGIRFDAAIVNAVNNDESIDESKKVSAIVYEGGIVFNPLKELKLYARYSSLFRYPFVDELAEFGFGFDSFNKDLEPEKGFNVEIGTAFKFGRVFDINANFFFMMMENEIAYNDSGHNENLDKTSRLGTNIGFSFIPSEYISLYASYSFVNAEFISGDNKNKQVPLVPAHKIYWNVKAKLPFGLEFGPDFAFTSGVYFGGDYANQADKIDTWFLFGASASYCLKKESREATFRLTAKNLLGANYSTTGFYSIWSNNYSVYPAEGRSIMVSLHYKF